MHFYKLVLLHINRGDEPTERTWALGDMGIAEKMSLVKGDRLFGCEVTCHAHGSSSIDLDSDN